MAPWLPCPPQAAAIYERMGYRHSESSYAKVLGMDNYPSLCCLTVM